MPGSQRLGERAQVDDIAEGEAVVAAQVFAIKHHERSDVLAFVPQLAIRIIFDDGDAVFVGQQNQLVTAALRQASRPPDSGSSAGRT